MIATFDLRIKTFVVEVMLDIFRFAHPQFLIGLVSIHTYKANEMCPYSPWGDKDKWKRVVDISDILNQAIDFPQVQLLSSP